MPLYGKLTEVVSLSTLANSLRTPKYDMYVFVLVLGLGFCHVNYVLEVFLFLLSWPILSFSNLLDLMRYCGIASHMRVLSPECKAEKIFFSFTQET
jgi:hypothetical protein